MTPLLLIGTFIGGVVGYLAIFIGCVGGDPGSVLSQTCTAFGPLLRTPLLYWLPYADSRYFGVDSLIIAVGGNAVFWGIVAAIVSSLIVRARRKRDDAR